MTLQEFLDQNNIRIDHEIFQLCMEAIEKMEKSQDVIHDHKHIYRILDSLTGFISSSENVRLVREIDFNVLLPAIAWHDVWKYDKNPFLWFPVTLTSLLFYNIENPAAARLFLKTARKMKIDESLSRKIFEELKRHGGKLSRLGSNKTLEGKIFLDLDVLDITSPERLNSIKDRYLSGEKVSWYKYFIAKAAASLFLNKVNSNFVALSWTKERFANAWLTQKKAIIDMLDEYKKRLYN